MWLVWSIFRLMIVLHNLRRFAVAMGMLFRGVNANEHCQWCHYLSCVPTSRWSCGNWKLVQTPWIFDSEKREYAMEQCQDSGGGLEGQWIHFSLKHFFLGNISLKHFDAQIHHLLHITDNSTGFNPMFTWWLIHSIYFSYLKWEYLESSNCRCMTALGAF